MQAQAYDVLWWWERWSSATASQTGLPPWYVSPQQLAQCSPTIVLLGLSYTQSGQYVYFHIAAQAQSGFSPSYCELANGVGYIGGPAPSISVNTLQGLASGTGWTQLSQGAYWYEAAPAWSLDTRGVAYLPQPGSYTLAFFYGYVYNGNLYSVGSYTQVFTYAQPSATAPSPTTPSTTTPSSTESWFKRYWWVVPLAAGGAAAAAVYFLLLAPPEEVAAQAG